MPFVKLVKNKAYFKRYQTKFRRRREGKTDFYARKRLVVQAKNKYASAKYRLVVRITNRAVICQVVYATLAGDQVLASAYSSELGRYGLKVGLKNYAAAYCTGLLVARRLLQKLGLDSVYEGNTEVDGTIKKTGFGRTYYVEELDDDRRPFRANLDVGIRCTTTGARVFGAMKGASDGGLDVPHTYKRFPGYDSESKAYNADEHRARIFGQHVAEYMKTLEEEDTTAYQRQFAEYIKAGVSADDLEKLYESVHSAIRADPSPTPKKERYHDSRYHNRPKLSYEQRKDRVRQKKIARARALQAQLAAEDED